MLHRITLLSAALVLALLILPLGVLPQAAAPAVPVKPQLEADRPSQEPETDAAQPETDIQPETDAAGAAPNEAEGSGQAQDGAGGETGGQAQDSAEAPTQEAGASEPIQLRVLLSDGTVETMALEDYLWGVLAAEMPASFRGQALKAQAVAARTYTLYQLAHPKQAHPEADVCTDYACCQAWISRADRLAQWPEEEREGYAARITTALKNTQGQVLTWEGEPILSVFHASSGGKTRSAQAVWGTSVPYLVSVDSPEGEGDAPNYYSVVTLTAQEFSELFLASCPEADLSGPCEDWFSAPETDESGAPAAFTVGGVTVTAQQLRSLCALRSANFTVECAGDAVTFYVTGYGHGVGMSQYGANVLAGEGLDYREILAHYYPGTELTIS